MVFNRRVLYLLVVGLVALITLCSPVWSEQVVYSGEDILRKVANVYKNIDTYQDKTTLVMNITAQGMEQKMKNEFSLVVERPNKLALILKLGTMGMTLVSNGQKVWTYAPMMNKYTVGEATDSFQGLLGESVLGMGMQGSVGIIMLSLFGNDPYATIMEGVEKVEIIGDETLEGIKTQHLLLHQETMDIGVWVATEGHLIRKVSIDMSKTIEKHKQSMPGLGEIKMIFEEIHEQIKTGDKIPDDTFVFIPPAGAEETDALFASLVGDHEVSPLLGKQAQNFKLPALKEGNSIHLENYKGKLIMLDFWATWCNPCLQELPILQKIYDKYKEKGVVFIAVNSGEKKKTVLDFIEKEGYTFPVALDIEGKVAELYEVDAYPTLIIIDKEGKIQVVHTGFSPDLKSRLDLELKQMLEGKDLAEVTLSKKNIYKYKPIPAGPDTYTNRKYREDRRKWLKKTAIDNYNCFGTKNKKWDDKALVFLPEVVDFFANYLEDDRDKKPITKLLSSSSELMELECTDPYIIYCHGNLLHKFGGVEGAGKAEPFIRKSLAMLEKSNYPRRYLYYAANVLGLICKELRMGKGDVYDELIDRKLEYFAMSTADKDFRNGHQRFIMDDFYRLWNGSRLKIYRSGSFYYTRIKLSFQQKEKLFNYLNEVVKTDPWIAGIISGNFYIEKAWESRGDGLASTVTEEGWEGFYKELGKADDALTKAYELHPEYPEAPAEMITVSMGAKGSSVTGREWFDRAVAAQMDYLPAYHKLQWFIRPRWGGSHNKMYAFGLECLNTKRFDTNVPEIFLKIVRDIGSELDIFRDAYRKPGTYEYMQNFFENILNEPTKKDSANYFKSYYALVAWADSRYDDAKTLFNELGDKLDKSVFKIFNITPELVIGEVNVGIGPFKNEVQSAEELFTRNQALELLPFFEKAYHEIKDDNIASSYLRSRIATLRIKKELQKGEWTNIMPGKEFAGWVKVEGEWIIENDGTLKGTSTEERDYGFMLICENYMNNRFEIKCEIETNYNAGLILGYAQKASPGWTSFRIYGNSNKCSLGEKFYSNKKIKKEIALQKKNDFLLQVWDSSVTAYINGQPVFISQEIESGKGQIGLVGHCIAPGKIIKIRNLQVRYLKTRPKVKAKWFK